MRYTVAIHNLGCKVNYYESVKMQEALSGAGFLIVDFESVADIYIVNTCTVTNIADRKSRQMLNRARSLNANAIVVAAGCYVKVAAADIKANMDIDVLVDNKAKPDIVRIITEELDKRGLSPSAEYINSDEESISGGDSHCRAFLKIQDGCDRYCSYCLIPFARGRVESLPHHEIMENVRAFAAKGYKELVLTGIHLSSYGRGYSNEATALADLINEISEMDGIERIRLGSLEQGIITDRLLSGISGNDKLLPHFHLSLQSGSDGVLGRMNRKYTADEFAEKCELIRKYYHKPALTTDIIVGFPQESDEEFAETVAFVERVGFYEAHIFPFSIRTGTRAAAMDGQLDNATKKSRFNILNERINRLRAEYIAGQLSETEEVLVEEKIVNGQEHFFKGYTKRYVPAYINASDKNIDLTNQIIRGKIIRSIMDGVELVKLKEDADI